jgi:hypothetical protein
MNCSISSYESTLAHWHTGVLLIKVRMLPTVISFLGEHDADITPSHQKDKGLVLAPVPNLTAA